MKKVLSLLKLIFWKPLVWVASHLKALALKVVPSKAAASADAKTFGQKVKDLWSALRDVWKDYKGWTWIKRIAVVIALVALMIGNLFVGWRVGHRKVPGLVVQVVAQGKTIASDKTVIAGLKVELADAKAALDAAKKAASAPVAVSKPAKAAASKPKAKAAKSSGLSFSGFFN